MNYNKYFNSKVGNRFKVTYIHIQVLLYIIYLLMNRFNLEFLSKSVSKNFKNQTYLFMKSKYYRAL